MNLELARNIFGAIEADRDGALCLNAPQKVREAKLMRAQGWLKLSKVPGNGSAVVARLTTAGERISRLFKDDAVAQRLCDAFSPGNRGDRS